MSRRSSFPNSAPSRTDGAQWLTIVGMDNLSSHKGPKVRALIEAAGATLLFRLPYSPDFNPIENAFAKLLFVLDQARKPARIGAGRTVAGLWHAI